ncbi:MAG: 4-alpha-glucanotransferase [Dyella sp.]|uniref:4-alpha-glucanotransferase n=1 Tax=Dyella sp. TaxID=1869338 RepID=UPI003F7D9428
MSGSSLEMLARAAGLSVQWTDASGQPRTVSDDALQGLLAALQLPAQDESSRRASLQRIEERHRALPVLLSVDAGDAFDMPPALLHGEQLAMIDEEGRPHQLAPLGAGCYRAPSQYGYYQLDAGNHSLMLAVAPPRCFGVGDALGTDKHRAWGLAAQVYSLRHANDGGLGDSRAVAELAETIGRAGGDAIALSPLHAMSPVAGHYSPYSPSHRGFLNWVHADPAQVLGAAALNAALQASGLASTWHLAQQGKLVDWPVAYALRRNVFRVLHEQFAHAPPTLRDDLQRFTAEGGDALKRHAWLAARQSQAMLAGESSAWQAWQDDWRSEASAAAFAQQHVPEVDLEIFLQWLAARCWESTQRRALDADQHIGLICDLAVGFEAGGGEAWTWREHVLQGLELGAPPDAFNPDGQRWGITSYAPSDLKASGFRPFIELLRANMQRGGGLRIDHIIGFQHIWVLPQGGPSTEGGYLRQPLQDLLRLTALESWRQRCIVIGEDLGTVPVGLRDLLAARGVLGIDVLLFTRDEQGEFLAPESWRKNAVATTTTHDLPPLAGWREGVDIAQLAKAHGFGEEEMRRRMRAREDEVVRLDQAVGASISSFRRTPDVARSAENVRRTAPEGGERSESSSLDMRPKDTTSILSASRGALKMDSSLLKAEHIPVLSPRAGVRRNDGEGDQDGEGNQAPTQACNYVAFLAQTPSPLLILPLEDALNLKTQPNLPGTVDSHPNWQHRLPENTIEQLQPLLQSIGTSVKEVTPA